MSDYTPTTEEVRGDYAHYQIPANVGGNLSVEYSRGREEFDRWLASVKADAWDEGHDQGWQSRKEFDLDGVSEWRNPYRQEESK